MEASSSPISSEASGEADQVVRGHCPEMLNEDAEWITHGVAVKAFYSKVEQSNYRHCETPPSSNTAGLSVTPRLVFAVGRNYQSPTTTFGIAHTSSSRPSSDSSASSMTTVYETSNTFTDSTTIYATSAPSTELTTTPSSSTSSKVGRPTTHPSTADTSTHPATTPTDLLYQLPSAWPYTQPGVARHPGQTATWTLTRPSTSGYPVAIVLASLLWYPRAGNGHKVLANYTHTMLASTSVQLTLPTPIATDSRVGSIMTGVPSIPQSPANSKTPTTSQDTLVELPTLEAGAEALSGRVKRQVRRTVAEMEGGSE